MKPEDTLTPAQFGVLRLRAEPMSTKDIQANLGIAEETVKRHLHAARQKTGTDDTVALVLWFVRKYPTEADVTAGYENAVVCGGQQVRNMITRGLGR